MEALPFLPFIQIPPKLTEINVTPSFSGAIRVAISQTGRNPDDFLTGLREFETLRNAMIVAIGDSAIHKSFLAGPSYYDVYGDALREYAVQTTSIFKRFGDIYIEGNAWQTANQKRNTVKSDTIGLELAAALWNHSHYLSIHALHELAAENDQNIKQAATNFQQAAGCLTYILAKTHDLPGKDLSPANIKFMILLMLQQAHEVIVIKALRDGKLQKTAAKLAWTCADYCEQLESLLPEDAGYKSSELKFLKTWVVFKMEFFQAITYFCQGMDAEERKEYGEAVTYFRQARQCLQNSQKQAAKLDSENDLAAALGYADDVINGKCTSAENDNEFIYHCAVKENLPHLGTLSKAIVNAVPWEPQDREYFGDIISEDIFISNSNYSDRLDQLWRDISKEIDEKNSELLSCKEALVIAGIDLESDENDKSVLPETLIQAAAQADKMNKNLTKVKTRLKSVCDLEKQVNEKIAAAEAKFKADEEMLKNSSFTGEKRAKFDADPAWLALQARIQKIKKAADQSKGPTETCKDAASLMAEKLELLGKGLPAVREELPTVVVSDDDAEAIGMVSMLLSKIREMENQREEQRKLLKDELDQDNITGKLAGEPDHLHTKIFDSEIAKHDVRIGYLRQNLSAQGNILAVLDDARVNYAEIYRRKRDSTQLYDEKCSQLINAIVNYDKIFEKLVDGEKLFQKILTELGKLDVPLDSASEQRSKALKNIITPKRPEKAKPSARGTEDLPKEMLDELKALGLEDDAEFIEFLKNSGEIKKIPVAAQQPAKVPRLPGISPRKVANAMRPGQNAAAPSRDFASFPRHPAPRPAVPATFNPQAHFINSATSAHPNNMNPATQAGSIAPPVSAPPDLPLKINFNSTIRPAQDAQNISTHLQNKTHHIPQNPEPAKEANEIKTDERTKQKQNHSSSDAPKMNQAQMNVASDQAALNHQNQMHQQQIFERQQKEIQKQQWMMQQQFQAQMQQQQQQIAINRQKDEAKLAEERRLIAEQLTRMEEERTKLEEQRLQFEKERKEQEKMAQFAKAAITHKQPQLAPSIGYQNAPSGEQWLLQYRNQQNGQSGSSATQNMPMQSSFGANNVQRPTHQPNSQFSPVYRSNTPSSTPLRSYTPAANAVISGQIPSSTARPVYHAPRFYNTNVPRLNTRPQTVQEQNNPAQFIHNQQSVIRAQVQPPLLRPTNTVKPISSIVPNSTNAAAATSQAPVTGQSQANRLSSNFDLLSSLHETATVPPATPQSISEKTNFQEKQLLPEFETSNLLSKISSLSNSLRAVVPRLVKVPDQVIQLITNTTYPPDQFRIMSKTIAAARCSPQLNRQQQLVPYDDNRVILRGGGNDYINASRVSTNCASLPFAIVGEAPLPSAQDDLWRMIWQENVETLVMIASAEEAENDSIMSWHPRDSNRQFARAGIIVESKLTEKNDFASVYTLTLSHKNIKRTISVFEITQWASQLAPNIAALSAATIKIATRFLNQRSKDIPVTFLSSNGDARCGTLLFILTLLISPDIHPLSLYKTLQESRCSLILARITCPVLGLFNSINSQLS